MMLVSTIHAHLLTNQIRECNCAHSKQELIESNDLKGPSVTFGFKFFFFVTSCIKLKVFFNQACMRFKDLVFIVN